MNYTTFLFHGIKINITVDSVFPSCNNVAFSRIFFGPKINLKKNAIGNAIAVAVRYNFRRYKQYAFVGHIN